MSSTHESKNFFLQGPAGKLEAVLWTPPAAAPGMAALVCHPHPVFGGTMHNKVVFQAAKALDSLGIAVLRFNFRGTGLSAGTHDRGKGETGDVQAAIVPSGLDVSLLGQSFLSHVGNVRIEGEHMTLGASGG